jgi:hypothetical protein
VEALFKTTGPLDFDQDRAIYVERPERHEIYQEIRRPYVENYVALLGSRQMGKTTLLYHIYRELRHAGDPAAFLDLSAYRVDGVSQSYAHAALRICQELADWLVTPARLRVAAGAVDGPIRFREFLLDLAHRCRGTRIVILLDEVGSFISHMGFFETLRSISSSGVHDSERAFKKYLFVFAGAVDLHDLTSGRNSPLANVCKSVYLKDFDLLGTEYLVSNLSQVAPVRPGLAEYIHRHAGGHPYLTQRICALIEADQRGRRSAERQIAQADVDRALDLLYEDDENLRYVTLQLERHEQAALLLRQILIEERTVPFSLIDSRVARLFVIGAIRRQKNKAQSADTLPQRAQCAIRNRIYERALQQYLTGLTPETSSEQHARSPAIDAEHYVDLTIRVRGQDAPFLVTVEANHSSVSGDVTLALESLDFCECVERVVQGQAQEGDLIALGTMLWRGIPSLAAQYAACRREAGDHKGVRIRLHLPPKALAALPWECLYDPERQHFPALSPWTPLARCIASPQPASVPPLFDLPLRILVVCAAPADGPVVEALRALDAQRTGQIQVLQHATVGSLQAALHRPYQVLHYIGPGGWRANGREGTLMLEADGGEAHPISGAQLAYLIRDTSVRLAVLDVRGENGIAAGPHLGRALVEAGLPAVLAMQFAISETSATILIDEFYRALADGWPVDAAVAEARKGVMAATDLAAVDWSSPALLMHSTENVRSRQRSGRD